MWSDLNDIIDHFFKILGIPFPNVLTCGKFSKGGRRGMGKFFMILADYTPSGRYNSSQETIRQKDLVGVMQTSHC